MGWMEGDLARSAFCVLLFQLVVFKSEGSTAHPFVISPSKPETASKIIQEILPSVQPNSFSDRNISFHKSPIEASSSPDRPQPQLPHKKDISPPQNESKTAHSTSSSLPHLPEGKITHKTTSEHSGSPAKKSKKREYHASHPSNRPIEILKNKRRHYAPQPTINGFEINPSASKSPIQTPKHKNSASSPYNGSPVINPAPLHPSVDSLEGPKISPAPSHPPMETPKRNRRHHSPPSYPQGPHLPPVQTPTSTNGEISAAPLPASTSPPPSYIIWQIHSPRSSPSKSFGGKSSPPSSQPKQVLPPPPPNLDCGPMICQSPLTTPCPGSPCECVLPIKVVLRLGVALYIFFPLVSEFAKEIAAGVSMKQSQVRIMGANSVTEEPEKTDVLIDLVPLGKSFDNRTGFMTFEKFWKKEVSIQASYFGDYIVLYVNYPGLPPSPPTAFLNGEAYANNNNGRKVHPFAVDVRKKKKSLGGSVIAIIAMTSLIAVLSFIGAVWFLLLRNRELSGLLKPNFQSSQTPFSKSTATGSIPVNVGIGPSSKSDSLCSNIATYNGSAKTFALAEIERTTNKFDESRVIGEGGFGRVYEGTLDGGTMVAVKVLKRDDREGEREFLAEVEMLSRLHHRNLVKLIGICAEENIRCLVYELIPNGSVDSHLHGIHKKTAPLTWNSRVKIALGAARALSYLHEDSSPRVIHRDFKSSNILLEDDFTPRITDFGLARSAFDEGDQQISTRVMGTFGYVDPEYAMTGHLLVKSDVYSYGVVLLELLTGRKPVDMSQPPGQENLVAWTRSLLANMEGLQTIIDPALGDDYPRNNVAKVAAIASMCVQPEVSHRPLMSEIAQALKLVWNERDEQRRSESFSEDEMGVRDVESGMSEVLCGGGDREGIGMDVLYGSSSFRGDASDSFRRHWSSGPLSGGRSRLFWQRVGGLGEGSSSEHGFTRRFWWRRHGWS
ncbi:receptor-like serine/threonine-protein kinase ALE2 isoform X2 [Phalaenopsis equestris]|uniref:receptor-like serine/threonine-protein kinase ALE2 isoform X2 n=1 Tax=Phalaenopsis equestris TaxID=78828 RepID=UPI0009E655B5|nr:receptor-like serine/threonine-protein kinase ALE2 isoform X2 [Phalaenopsis equestris]